MDGPLAASKAKFQAALNEHHNSSGTLSFSSIYYDWTMFANEYSLQFRVGASKETD